jgi:uncharacterized protein (DUF2062 family)
VTFISNPFTTLLVILPLAVAIGNSFGYHADMATVEIMVRKGSGLETWWSWLLSDTAPAVVIGLFIQSLIAAFVSYFLSMWFWRFWVGRKHRARGLRPRRADGDALAQAGAAVARPQPIREDIGDMSA